MKKPTVNRVSGFAKVGASVALGVAAVTVFIVNTHAPSTNATVIENVKNGASAIVRAENSSAVSTVEGAEQSPSSSVSSSKNESTPININTATAAELQRLSGIGEAKAAAIIAYREARGGFSDISEIMNVSGIGEKIFDEICERITVGNVSTPTHNDTPTIAPAATFPININTASADELRALSGIGEAKAAAIIAYREEHGEFSDIAEIKNVSGIGEKIFDEIRGQITVGNVSTSTHNYTSPNTPTATFPININTASADELRALSGIGEAKAAAIIAYREEHGGFSDISEIMNVSGIGEKLFNEIRGQITVGNVSTPTHNDISQNTPAVTFPININTASADELQALSGIGEAKAAAIIAYREEHGGFSDIAEIKNVSGIGEKIFEKIRADITV